MPVGKPKGLPKSGGRKKGTPNKDVSPVRSMLERIGHDPLEGMARIAQNMLPCGVCRGELKTRYWLQDERPHCDRCGGGLLVQGKPARPKADCIWCSGTGKQTLDERTCQSCKATGWEACSPELRGKMDAELAKYVQPQLKAIEHSISDPTQKSLAEILTARRDKLAAK